MSSHVGPRTPRRLSALAALVCFGGLMVLVVDASSAGTARPDVGQGQTAAGRVAPAAASQPSMNAGLDPRLLRASASRRALLASRASGPGFTENALVSANAGSLSRSQA